MTEEVYEKDPDATAEAPDTAAPTEGGEDVEVKVHVAGETDAEGAQGDADAAAQDASAEAKPEEELDPLEKALRDATEWRERAMRTQAELENFRKRMTRERSEAIQYANARLFESLLPILDNFEMGLKAAKNESEDSMIFQGMNMVFRQVQDFLQDNGVTGLDAEGEVFDPNLHEAVEQQYSDEVEEGRIIAVLRRGFRLNERLLRAANVVVSKGVEPAGGVDSQTEGDGNV